MTGALVNRICNLERAEEFMCKIGGPRLICKGLGLRVDIGKDEGPECKSGGNMITRELFF
jgi:hypothetical protein